MYVFEGIMMVYVLSGGRVSLILCVYNFQQLYENRLTMMHCSPQDSHFQHALLKIEFFFIACFRRHSKQKTTFF